MSEVTLYGRRQFLMSEVTLYGRRHFFMIEVTLYLPRGPSRWLADRPGRDRWQKRATRPRTQLRGTLVVRTPLPGIDPACGFRLDRLEN